MSEYNKILKQNAILVFSIVNLIETLDRDIKALQTKYTYKDKNLDIRIYKDLKKYLEEVLEASYGKR